MLSLCLIAFATSAVAEAAWVLWWESRSFDVDWHPQHHDREVLSAYPTSTLCESARAQSVKDTPWLFAEGIRNPDVEWSFIGEKPEMVHIFYKNGRKDSYRVLCLPDTADPRGPKGK